MMQFANDCHATNKIIGFVPTMGALHIGHESLVQQAVQRCHVCVASIFVNPTQFNNAEDLKKYPRTFDSDVAILERNGCHVVFFPSTAEMYPHGLQTEFIDLQGLDLTMEGVHRPGHFAGVVTVVKHLFEIVKPHIAFFGEKDFQQLAIIKYMTHHLQIPVQIVACPTIREQDGLAFSSRNIHLTGEERAAAPLIYDTLMQCHQKKNTMSIEALKSWATARINNSPFLHVEYIEFVNAQTLIPLSEWSTTQPQRVCIAVHTSKTRLIDNAEL